MANNLATLRRAVFRSWDASAKNGAGDWETFTMEPDDLGQDTQMEIDFTPRKMSRSSSVGTTETPIPGTFDTLTASITFLADTWELIGKALGLWNPATYAGATAGDGQIIIGGAADYCSGNKYLDVVLQGVCDDGSALDVEVTRCLPSLDGGISLGGTDATEVTLALNPIIYNASTHANDGYPGYTLRFGAQSLTEKTRLNAATGVYAPVTTGTIPEEG